MRVPSFFKVKSRIGLKNPPIHQMELNIGVEDGPDAVISEKFQESFPQGSLHTYKFPQPENIDSSHFYSVLTKSAAKCRDFINNTIIPGATQIVVGGDHSVTFPSVLALLDRIQNPNKIGYVQFDSHGDILLESESTTKNFHGMYIRALVDHFDIPEVEKLVPHKIPIHNLLYIGNLDLEKPEEYFFKTHTIKTISKKDLTEKYAQSLVQFREFVSRFDHMHISFDVDGLDQSIAPATGIPAHDGLIMEDVTEMLTVLSKHPSFSLDVVEVNPHRNGAKQTITAAQEVIRTLLS